MVSVYSEMLGSTCVTHHQVLAVDVLTKFEHVLIHISNHRMGIHKQLGLKRGQLAMTKYEPTAHTLKITMILISSDFQAVITSESLFA